MNNSFGSTLRALRRNTGISQRELAKRIGRDFSYISKIENDRLPPPAADTVVAISKALSTNPDHLLALTGKIPSEIQQAVSTSERAQRFLREVQQLSLTEEEWDEMLQSLRDLREE